MPDRILIVHEDPDVRRRVAGPLLAEGHEVVEALPGPAAVPPLDRRPFDVLFCEPGARGLDGLPLLPQALRRQPEISVVLLGDRGPESLRALRKETFATELLLAPFLAEEVLLVLDRARARRHLLHGLALADRDVERLLGERTIVAASDGMIELLERLERVAGLDVPVLITGEAGVGKETIARALHAQSSRRRSPFVVVPCATDPTRLEHELFAAAHGTGGDVPGPHRAGLIERAAGGTLFLDEVTALPDGVLQRLLEVLSDAATSARDMPDKARTVDVRLLASTRHGPGAERHLDGIQVDLLDRLAAARLDVPPLRARRDDIPLLVYAQLSHATNARSAPARSLSDEALELLVAYDWPGNLRELVNVVERAASIAGPDGPLDAGAVARAIGRVGEHAAHPSTDGEVGADDADLGLRRARRRFETGLIRRALARTGGNRTHAARLLEISHRALLYKLKEYGIRD
ncbi:MAG: sigma 54-interacting transcriptional regulator [Myxococcota bacterium]